MSTGRRTPPDRATTPERVGIHHQFERSEMSMMLDYIYDTDKHTYKFALEHVKSYIVFMEEQKRKWLALNPSIIPSSMKLSAHDSLYDGDSIFNSPILLDSIDNELELLNQTPCPLRGRQTTTLTSDLMEATFSD